MASREIDTSANELKPYWVLKKANEPWLGYGFIKLTNPNLRIWVQDFTYIKHGNKFFYLATTLSFATREVLGWSFGFYHDANLVCEALEVNERNLDERIRSWLTMAERIHGTILQYV